MELDIQGFWRTPGYPLQEPENHFPASTDPSFTHCPPTWILPPLHFGEEPGPWGVHCSLLTCQNLPKQAEERAEHTAGLLRGCLGSVSPPSTTPTGFLAGKGPAQIFVTSQPINEPGLTGRYQLTRQNLTNLRECANFHPICLERVNKIFIIALCLSQLLCLAEVKVPPPHHAVCAIDTCSNPTASGEQGRWFRNTPLKIKLPQNNSD